MTSFKLLGAALVFSALLATPASAWEPAAAEAMDPTFSIYSGMRGSIYSGASQTPLGNASVRPHRGNHTTRVKRY
jgi:hypothetical protein